MLWPVGRLVLMPVIPVGELAGNVDSKESLGLGLGVSESLQCINGPGKCQRDR